MNDNDKIAAEIKAERARVELEKSRPAKVSNTQVKQARFVWMVGTVAIDLLTAFLIYEITTYWYYAGVWVLAGAAGLIYSENLKGRVGNNAEQMKIGETGVLISAGAVVAMALLMGTVWVMKIQAGWIFAVMEISALGLFFFHLYQSYQYHAKDDDVILQNEEARLEEAARRQINEAHRAARLVNSKKIKNGVLGSYRAEQGAAFDAAYNQEAEREDFTNRQRPNE